MPPQALSAAAVSPFDAALERARDLPLSRSLPLPLFAALVAWYITVSPWFSGTRKRAYVLSTLSSCLMTAASVPFALAYLRGGYPGLYAFGADGHAKVLADTAVAFFGTYLFCDLVVGSLAYPAEVGMLTGWVHHTVYIGIMVHLATSTQSPVFLAAAIMELPTFDLAMSNLFPALRSDARFLSLMALTRILYNAVMLVDALRPASLALNGSRKWMPPAILGLALAMHASWMHGGVTGYLRRRAKARAAARAEADEKASLAEPSSTLSVPATPALGACTPGLDATTPLFGPVSPGSPDESPLVTPHTPGQPTTILRDNLFPNITIPTMANLPIPAIPTLSDMAAALPQAKANLNQLQIGAFTEAVNRRWEEQRDRLAAKGEAFLRRRRGNPDTAGPRTVAAH